MLEQRAAAGPFPVDALRRKFSALSRAGSFVFFDNGAGAQVPDSVLEAVTDPEVPPLPPHISFEQAKNFALATVGDPARGAMVGNALKQMLASLVPGR